MLLSFLVLVPLAGTLVIVLLPRAAKQAIKIWALLVALVELGLSLTLVAGYSYNVAGMQFQERYAWLPQLGSSFHLGIDGLGLLMVLLTTFLMVVAIPASYNGITERLKEYYALFLLLEAALVGVFMALDLVLFYIFWEFTLIPMALIIGIWGHGRRIYAAVKFILFTMSGSLLMLVAILVLYFTRTPNTFDLLEIQKTTTPAFLQPWLFAAFALAFAIKVPMWPLHTWLPDAHVQAPTAGSIILAGVMLKLGAYGFIRFAVPLFPDFARQIAPLMIALAIVGILYGALVAMMQPDVKSLVAYSSVSHLGFVMLGIFSFTTQGYQGAVLQMVNHGLATGALFLLIGLLYERRHTRLIADFGGLAKVMPVFAAFFLIVLFASAGLPGLNGFVGEFLVLLGAWQANPLYAALAAGGVVLAAVYLLWMYMRVMQGEVMHEENRGLPDLSRRETALLGMLTAGIILIGVYPNLLLRPLQGGLFQLAGTW